MTIWEAIQDAKARKQGDRRPSNLPAVGAIVGTDIGTALMSRHLLRGLFDNAAQIPMEHASELDVPRLARMAGLNIKPEAAKAYAENAFYRPPGLSRLFGRPAGQHGTIGRVGPRLTSSIPADVAAHEIGHGLSWSGKAGLLPQLIARARIPGQMGAGLAGLVGLLKGTSGQRSLEEREKWLNRASLMGGIGMLPVLADEALASRNALKFLRSAPAAVLEKEIAQQAVRRLAKAWGSYGLASLGLVLGPQLAKHYYQQRHE